MYVTLFPYPPFFQSGCSMACEVDEAKALEAARAFPGLAGMDLAKVVSCKESHHFEGGEWELGLGYAKPEQGKYKVVAFDYGVKHNILRDRKSTRLNSRQ